VDRESDVLANLKVLAGTDEDLAHDITRAINRLRSLLLQIHPALERVFKGTVLTRTHRVGSADPVPRTGRVCVRLGSRG
jgi:CHAD domain-containing protein